MCKLESNIKVPPYTVHTKCVVTRNNKFSLSKKELFFLFLLSILLFIMGVGKVYRKDNNVDTNLNTTFRLIDVSILVSLTQIWWTTCSLAGDIH